MKTDGSWNDFINNNSNVKYYVIEYGGMPGESATTTGLTILTIESVEASESTYNAFDDKQLKGIVEAHNESIKNSLSQSTDSILRRMEQYRRFENNQSLKMQDLKFVLNDKSNNEDIDSRTEISIASALDLKNKGANIFRMHDAILFKKIISYLDLLK